MQTLYQNKYRKSQANKGLVRYELQIPLESKESFEEVVKAVADEYAEPFSLRQRMAQARVQVFDEITRNVKHDFMELKKQIAELKGEIKALSPTQFSAPSSTAIPEAIKALSDNPDQLKKDLSKLYAELQQSKLQQEKHRQNADRYKKLYDAATDYNDDLKRQLSRAGFSLNEID